MIGQKTRALTKMCSKNLSGSLSPNMEGEIGKDKIKLGTIVVAMDIRVLRTDRGINKDGQIS